MKTMTDLLYLSTEEFRDVVESDLRYRPDPDLLAAGDTRELESAALRETLRSPDLIERYYYALVAISKRVEATLGARRSDLQRDRSQLGEAAVREAEQKYVSQRSSTLRFKGGLDQALADAKRLLNEHRGVQYEHLNRRIDELEAAIRKHKLALESDLEQTPSDYDTELWRVING